MPVAIVPTIANRINSECLKTFLTDCFFIPTCRITDNTIFHSGCLEEIIIDEWRKTVNPPKCDQENNK